MTALRLIVLLGPSATVEAAELKMGALPHTLAMAVPFDSWDEAAGSNVLPVAMAKVAEMFLTGIKRGEHLAEPAPEPGDEGEAHHPVDVLTTAQKNAAIERTMRVPAEADDSDTLDEIMCAMEPDLYVRWHDNLDKARRIVALVERRAA